MRDYLSTLNQRQKDAVLHTEGPLLIVAGAGAGKTKTLTHRILHLIAEGVEPKKILAITFTNKAAKEMKERVQNLLSTSSIEHLRDSQPFVSTFHSLGVHVIKEFSHLLNLPKRFTIFDRDDSKRAVREALKASNLDPKQYEPGKILAAISREKGNQKTYTEFAEASHGDYFRSIISDVWKKYEETLAREKALDFDDLLLKTALLLSHNKDVLEHYHATWHYIHIDEYQDTNKVQYTIAKKLAEKNRNICVVGDADQTIYTWRGATIDNILHFERDYPDAHTILLEQNYRSTQTILSAANSVIEKNKKRQKKRLFTEGKEGEKITRFTAFDENDEARYIAEQSESLIRSGVSPSDIAVLYRANYQSRALEEAFLSYQVPYQVLGTRFFERKEIKDVLSYIRLACNPENMTDLVRIINEPTRGIGKVTVLKILEGKENELTGSTAEKVSSFRRLMKELQHATLTNKPSDVIKLVLKKSGLEEHFLENGDEGEERLENVKELVTLATKYDFMPDGEGIEMLLTDASLASDQDSLNSDNGGVKLLTVHASKGLEFETVFITGLEEGLFPHQSLNEKKADDEEERRLFYVALTRAKQKLFLTHAHMRTIFGSKNVNVASQFFDDIQEDTIESLERDGDTERRSIIKDIFIDF